MNKALRILSLCTAVGISAGLLASPADAMSNRNMRKEKMMMHQGRMMHHDRMMHHRRMMMHHKRMMRHSM